MHVLIACCFEKRWVENLLLDLRMISALDRSIRQLGFLPCTRFELLNQPSTWR
jgi:hypothetical protein